MLEEGERIPSPIPKEQEKQNEEDDEKQEEHPIQASERQRSEEDVSAETGEGDLSTLSPAIDTPVCAKNISLTASGERVILWTRLNQILLGHINTCMSICMLDLTLLI